MKKCFKCGIEKPSDCFYRHPRMADGRLGKCKTCAKEDGKANYRERHDAKREYDRQRLHTPRRKAQRSETRRRLRVNHPEKYAARNAATNAIRDGRLIRKPCEVCGEPKSEAHHPDYSQPLDVRWLCFHHHRLEHGALIESELAAIAA